MLAGITQTAELALDPTEAADLSKAIAAVGRHYDMTLPAKTLDWTNLMMVAGAVYGPRLIVILNNRRSARARPATMAPAAAPSGGGGSSTPTHHADGTVEVEAYPGGPKIRRTLQ
jgi:hypothetical protein